MKEFKGTKGEWNIVSHDNEEIKPSNRNFGSVTGKEGFYICRIWKDLINGEEEAEANAKLIAAAPELLEACQEMYQWFKNESTDGIQDDALELAKKAINKALK